MSENVCKYCDYRSNIKSGDLLAWHKGSGGFFSNIAINLVRFFTSSDIGHVGIAWRAGNRLFVIEAAIPDVRITPVSDIEEFYHIPMKIRWLRRYEIFLFDKIGLSYSISDCIRAYFGISIKNNNKWQCAELVNEFYKHIGIDLGSVYEPGPLVKTVLSTINTSSTLVSNNKK